MMVDVESLVNRSHDARLHKDRHGVYVVATRDAIVGIAIDECRGAHGAFPMICLYHDVAVRLARCRDHQSAGTTTLKEPPPHVFAGVDATDDQIDDAGRSVDDTDHRPYIELER